MRRSPARGAFAATAIRAFAAIAACMVVPHALVAQSQAKRALAIEDFYRLKTVGAPEISTTGSIFCTSW